MDDNFFAQLQAISQLDKESTIKSLRQQLNQIVEFFKSQPDYLENVTIMAEKVRFLEVQTLLDCDSFMVQDDFIGDALPEDLRVDALGFCRDRDCLFQGRYIYPVKDVMGDVMGFCGYDKFSEIKYMDSRNVGYTAKQYTLWGMEKLPEYYRDEEPVFFTEGIVCALYLRQCGLHSLAYLGSSLSAYVCEIIRRFGTRAIIVCDSDEAGTKTRTSVKYHNLTARVVQSTVAKDVDDSRQVNPEFGSELAKLRNPFYYSSMFR